MAPYPVLRIKPGREWPLKNHHHAIYKNAIESLMGIETGSIAEVQSSEGEFLCYATINLKAYICGRAIAFEKGDPMATLRRNIKNAIELRRHLLSGEDTTAVRLINAEGDAIPGLIVDQYGDIVVMQITTLGMDRLRPWIIQTLDEFCTPTAIFEKSTGASRKSEGLEPKEGSAKGTGPDTVTVTERGLKYLINLMGSQKTGLFIDQREMRSLVKSLAPGRTVLDVCSYTGG
jgi:23S rRNA (cytosine1962-C5)-methyltransferase